MAPLRSQKQVSKDSLVSPKKRTTFRDIERPSTPQRSPIRKLRAIISLQQKQALLENLRLEITERARRLRSQYHLQAQGLRSRIEIRLNRIPTGLRHLKMGELLVKYLNQQGQHVSPRPPPVPAKGIRLSPRKPQTASHPKLMDCARKRMSNEVAGDKENDIECDTNHKKRVSGADTVPVRSAQVLSPTSSNSRLANREPAISPTKSQIAKPSSPLKTNASSRSTIATNLLSSMVQKAKTTRSGGTRKVTTTSTSSTSSGTTLTRTRRAVANNSPKAPRSRPATRVAHRASGNSESSEGSMNTVVRKTTTTRRAAASTTRKAVPANTKKSVGVVASKAVSANTASIATNTTGRVLRKRGGA